MGRGQRCTICRETNGVYGQRCDCLVPVYADATVDQIIAASVLAPITNAITNPAPIEHGLVMTASVTGSALDADRIAEMRARLRAKLDAQEAAIALRSAMWLLARNIRDAAGCALAFDFGNPEATPTRYIPGRGWVETDTWEPNLDGKPAPGWER